jgi:hypothetical protein
MMRKLLLLFALLMVALPVAAQDDDCGNGLPCGPLPWRVPSLPDLSSPTPFPTELFRATETPAPETTDTPAPPTSTPMPTATIEPPDTSGIDNAVSELELMLESTSEVFYDADGNEFDGTAQDAQFGEDAGRFFGLLRGLTNIHLGKLTPLIGFFFFGLVWTISMKATTIVLPILAAIFGFIRRLVQFVLDFIPG